MKNPFNIKILQEDREFCNRTKERKDLLQYARNGANVVLCSPRRYGKSSLVTMVLSDLRKEGFLTAYVDLFPISSEQDFINRFASAIFKGFGQGVDGRSVFEKAKDIFASLRPVIEATPEGYSVSLRYDKREMSSSPLDNFMEDLYKYVKKRKLSACIVLDEFQEITELPEAKKLEGTLRSYIQFQKEISYFYVGSRRRILQDMFNNRTRPFYKSAFFYSLDKISANDFIKYIEECFKNTGKTCASEIAKNIYDRVEGYPYYVQKLASIVWNNTEKDCTIEIVSDAFHSLVDVEIVDFEGMWSGLSLIQKSVVKAVADNPTATPYAREYLERNQLSLGGAQKALNVLLKKDLIEKNRDGVYVLTDPIMTAWLRRT